MQRATGCVSAVFGGTVNFWFRPETCSEKKQQKKKRPPRGQNKTFDSAEEYRLPGHICPCYYCMYGCYKGFSQHRVALCDPASRKGTRRVLCLEGCVCSFVCPRSPERVCAPRAKYSLNMKKLVTGHKEKVTKEVKRNAGKTSTRISQD